MADNATNESILFEVKINAEQYKAEQKQIRDSMAQLTLSIEKTREAQKSLDAARKSGKVSDTEYSQQSVKLRTELNQQRGQMRELEKGLRTSEQAYTSAAGSIDQLKARSAELTTAYNALSKEERTATEAGQRLTAELLEVNKALLGGGEAVNDFRRNVGNYPKGESLAPLIQQLVRLEELQKSGALTAEEAAQADRDAIGYKQRIAQAGAQEGKSYDDTTALLKSYGDAIRPAVAELVKLDAEQQQVAESGKEAGEEVARIGFRYGQAQKAIKDATDALKEVPPAVEEAATETKGLGEGLLDAAKSSDVLGGTVEVLTSAKEKYTVAVNLAKAATTGEVSVLGLLRAALLATGLGALVVVLGLIVSGLTKSQAATDFLSRKMAALSGVIRPLLNLGTELGDNLTAAADNPKQAFQDLVDFIGDQVLNRLKAFGVIISAIKNGDVKGIANGFLQLNTGVEDVIGKVQRLGTEMATAARSAEQIEKETQRIREAERALNVERDQSRAKIEGLKMASDDTTKSVAARTAAAREAAAIENRLLAQQMQLQDDKIKNLRAEQALKQSLTTEDKDALADLQRERAQTTQESLTLQTELQNKLNSLVQEGLDKRIAARAQALAVEAAMLNKQLPKTQEGSNEELNLLQRKLKNGYEAELNVKNLTVAQKKAIDLKYETDSTALLISYQRQAAQLTLQAEQERNNASLALNAKAQAERVAQGLKATQQQLDEQYNLERRAVGLEQELALASLSQRADNEAARLRIRAEALRKLATLEAADADAGRQRRAKELSDEAQHYNLLADAQLAGRSQAEQLQAQASDSYKEQRIAAVLEEQDARLAVVVAGSQDEANIRLEAENRIRQIQADSQQAQLELLRQQTEKVAAVVSGSLSSLSALQDADSQAKLARIDAEMNKEGVSAARKAVLEKQKLRVEQQAAEQRKKFARAQAVISLGQAVMTILQSPAAPFVEPAASIVRGIEIAAATATAYAQFRAIDSAKFALGGIAQGPSHAHGGIQLTKAGRPVGIEIEGGEPVLTAAVSRNPVLLGMASMINQLAGGRALYRDPTPPATWARWAEGGVVSSSAMYLPQVRTGGVVQALAPEIDYDRLGQAVAKYAGPAFIAGAQALPAPETNLVELSRRLKQQEDFEKMKDI